MEPVIIICVIVVVLFYGNYGDTVTLQKMSV